MILRRTPWALSWRAPLAALLILTAAALIACGGSDDGDDPGDGSRDDAAAASTSSGGGQGDDGDDDGDDDREEDGDGTSGDATTTDVPETLELGESYSFELPEGSVRQAFTFMVPPGAILTVEAAAAPDNASSTGVSIGPAGQQARRFDLGPDQELEPYRYVTRSEGGGNWAIEIAGQSGNRIDLIVNAPLQMDGGVEGDAGSNATATQEVALGTPLSGLMGDEDSEDWYAVPLGGGDVVRIDVDMLDDTGTGGVNAELLFNGQTLGIASVFPGGQESLTQIFAEDQTGMAQLRLFGNGVYNFTINAGPQRDGGIEGDAGGDQATARAVEVGMIEGVLGGEDRDDYYRLTLPLAAVVTLEVSIPAAGNVPTLFDAVYNGQSLLISAVELAPGQTESYHFVLNNEADDDLILHVSLGGPYSIDIEAFTQTDGGDGTGDAPDVEDLAKGVTPEGSFDGYLNNFSGYDGRDWYRFTAAASGSLSITLDVDAAIGADVNVRINEFGGLQLDNLDAGPGGSSSVTVDLEEGVEYSLHVSTGQQAKYTITFAP
jgi:hypothetical protein